MVGIGFKSIRIVTAKMLKHDWVLELALDNTLPEKLTSHDGFLKMRCIFYSSTVDTELQEHLDIKWCFQKNVHQYIQILYLQDDRDVV